MFHGCNISFDGGYLGVIAKLGPFCSRDNCSLVRGVLDRLITHLFVQSVHVSVLVEGGSPGAGFEAAVLLEGGGTLYVAGTVIELEAWGEVLEILDGTLWCPLKLFWQSMLSMFTACLLRL